MTDKTSNAPFRKGAQAILEYFNETGFTKRVEDRHVFETMAPRR